MCSPLENFQNCSECAGAIWYAQLCVNIPQISFYRSGLDGQYNSDFGVCLSFAKPASNIVGNAIIESQRTARFIQWLQTALYRKDSAADIMTKLKRVWHPKNPELFHTDPQDMKENKLEKSLPVKGTFDIIHVNGNDAVGNLLRGK